MLRPVVRMFLTLGILTLVFPAVGASSWAALAVASIVLAFLSGVVRPILKLLFLPINIITLGLFSSVINLALIWSTTVVVPGFSIGSVVLFGYDLPLIVTLALVSILIGFINQVVRTLV